MLVNVKTAFKYMDKEIKKHIYSIFKAQIRVCATSLDTTLKEIKICWRGSKGGKQNLYLKKRN